MKLRILITLLGVTSLPLLASVIMAQGPEPPESEPHQVPPPAPAESFDQGGRVQVEPVDSVKEGHPFDADRDVTAALDIGADEPNESWVFLPLAFKNYWRSWTQVNADGFGDVNNGAISELAVFGNHLYAGTSNYTTGRELWRSSDGVVWIQVNTDGFGDAGNSAIGSLGVFDGYLYAGTYNSSGSRPQLWRSSDGTTWIPVIDDGFGDPYNLQVCSLGVFDGYLYAGTYYWNDGGQLWRSSDGTSWTRVVDNGFGDRMNFGIESLAVFDNYLYAGTWNNSYGSEMWRSPDGTTWTQVNNNGFGDPYNSAAPSLAAFGNHFYAGTMVGLSPGPAAEVWRTPDGTTWTQVNSEGFGDSNNVGVMSLTRFGDELYAGTSKYPAAGAEVWRSSDGASWNQVNEDGFADPNNSHITSLAVFDGYLYAGTFNGSTGAEVWRIPE